MLSQAALLGRWNLFRPKLGRPAVPGGASLGRVSESRCRGRAHGLIPRLVGGEHLDPCASDAVVEMRRVDAYEAGLSLAVPEALDGERSREVGIDGGH